MKRQYVETIGILFCAWLLAVDPYTWSQWNYPLESIRPVATVGVTWQGPVAAMLLACLGGGLVLLPLNRRAALAVLAVECALFVAVNALYLMRDGSGRILGHGYTYTAAGIGPLIGLAVRVHVLRSIGRPRSADGCTPGSLARNWPHSTVTIALVLACATLILIDPYTWGNAGYGWGRSGPRPDTSWQGLFAVCLVASLALGVLVYARTRRLAFTIFLVECAAYFLVNIALVARDGSGRFSSASFLHVGGGLFVFLGLGLRLMLLQQARRREAGTP